MTTPSARADAARNWPTNTCAASRHAQQIGEDMIQDEWFDLDGKEATEAGESILSTVAALYEARTRIAALEGQRGVLAGLLRECLEPLEISAAMIESDDSEAMEELIDKVKTALGKLDAIGALKAAPVPAQDIGSTG